MSKKYKKFSRKVLEHSRYFGKSILTYRYRCVHCGNEGSWYLPYKGCGELNGECMVCGLPVGFSHIDGVPALKWLDNCIIEDGTPQGGTDELKELGFDWSPIDSP